MKELSLHETRIIGCLIEKSLTTPDQYPLSLNALTNACNQKSNREPVMSLTENQVQDTVQGLESVGLVSAQTGFGSRVSKYLHRFCNTEFGELKLGEQELGIICVLFLRGPQTPGELRTRTNRLCTFAQLSDVESVLDKLASRDSGALVTKLSREPGKREVRYGHLFSGDDWSDEGAALSVDDAQVTTVVGVESGSPPVRPQQDASDVLLRVQALESQVAQLLSRIDELESLVLDQ